MYKYRAKTVGKLFITVWVCMGKKVYKVLNTMNTVQKRGLHAHFLHYYLVLFCTQYLSKQQISIRVLHSFHTPYNMHYFLKKMNYFSKQGDNI